MPHAAPRLAFAVLIVVAGLAGGCRPATPATIEEAVARAEAHRARGEVYDALWLYTWAGEQEHYPSQLTLADYYRQGYFPDVPTSAMARRWRDADRATAWCRLAAASLARHADAGDAVAARELGELYEPTVLGDSCLPPDAARAQRLYRQAAAGGDARAHVHLGQHAGWSGDLPRAERHFDAAVALGFADACVLKKVHRDLARRRASTAAPGAVPEVGEVLRMADEYAACIEVGSEQAVEGLDRFVRGIRRAADEGNPASRRYLAALEDAGFAVR